MNRQERLLAAVRRQSVDRVPYATYNLHPYANTPHTHDPTYAGMLDRVRTTAGTFIKIAAAGAGEALSRQRPEHLESTTHGSGDARTLTRTLHTPRGDLTSVFHAPGFMTRRVEAIARVVNGRTGYIMSPTCTPFQFPCSDTYRRNYEEWLDASERLLA
jgi:hypothetical protein